MRLIVDIFVVIIPFPCFLVLFFPLTSVSGGHVAPAGHFAQCALAHSSQLLGGRKSTCFHQSGFPRVWPLLIDQGGPVTQAWPTPSSGILN